MGNQIARPMAPNNTFDMNPSARAKARSSLSDIISKRIWTQMIIVHIPTYIIKDLRLLKSGFCIDSTVIHLIEITLDLSTSKDYGSLDDKLGIIFSGRFGTFNSVFIAETAED